MHLVCSRTRRTFKLLHFHILCCWLRPFWHDEEETSPTPFTANVSSEVFLKVWVSEMCLYFRDLKKSRGRGKYIIFLMYLHGKQFKTYSNSSLWTLFSQTNCIALGFFCLIVSCCVVQGLKWSLEIRLWQSDVWIVSAGSAHSNFWWFNVSLLGLWLHVLGYRGQKWSCCAVLASALAGTGSENQNHRGIN